MCRLWASWRVVFLIARPNRRDLLTLRELIDGGSLRPVVERCCDLREISDALAHIGSGHARGKLVIRI